MPVVNRTKSKIMILNKKYSGEAFTFIGEKLEICDTYKYLGIILKSTIKTPTLCAECGRFPLLVRQTLHRPVATGGGGAGYGADTAAPEILGKGEAVPPKLQTKRCV